MAKKDPTNAQIADAFSELGTLYELDGADRFRVNAYRDAAKTMRQCPVSIAELTRAGKVTELPGIGKTSAEKIKAFLDTGTIPSAEKLKAKFPATLVEVTRIPGLGAKTARRLFDEIGVASIDDLREAVADERIRSMKGLGPEGRGEHRRAAREARRRGACRARPPLRRPAHRREARRRPARAPGLRGGRGRGLGPPPGRDVQGRRPDRHRQGPEGARDRAGGAPARRRVGQPRARRGQDHHSERRLDRPADRRARGLREPPPALHRLGRAQRRAPRARRQDGPLGLRARDHRRRVRQGRAVRDREPRSTSGWAWSTSSRSSARRAARSRRRATASCRSSSPRTTSRATSTPTPPSPTARTSSRRWSRRRARSATRTSPSPTTRPRTASATT